MDADPEDLELALAALRSTSRHDTDYWFERVRNLNSQPANRRWIAYYMLGVSQISQYLEYELAVEAFEKGLAVAHDATAQMHLHREIARVWHQRPGRYTEQAQLHIDRAIALVPIGDYSQLGYCYGLRAAIFANRMNGPDRKGLYEVGHMIGEYGRAVALTRAGDNRTLELETLLAYIKRLVYVEQFELASTLTNRAFILTCSVGSDDEHKEIVDLASQIVSGEKRRAAAASTQYASRW